MNTEIWRHIFDSIEDPAFLHDAQFRVLFANAARYVLPLPKIAPALLKLINRN